MTDHIKIINLPDGGAIVEMDGEVEHYTKDEIAEMERDYKVAILRKMSRSREGVKQIMNKKEAAQDERLVWDEVSEVTWDKADQYGVTW